MIRAQLQYYWEHLPEKHHAIVSAHIDGVVYSSMQYTPIFAITHVKKDWVNRCTCSMSRCALRMFVFAGSVRDFRHPKVRRMFLLLSPANYEDEVMGAAHGDPVLKAVRVTILVP